MEANNWDSQETVASVMSWVGGSGIDLDRIRLTPSENWVEVNATVSEAEQLLQTEYYIYDHSYGASHIACQEYTLPSHLSADHIDIILPSVHFDAKITPPQKEDLFKRNWAVESDSTPVNSSSDHNVGLFNGQLPKPGKQVNVKEVQIDTSTCDEFIIPDCLRLLYSFGNGTVDSSSSYGYVVHYNHDATQKKQLTGAK